MKIFSREIEDGLEHLIASTASVSYAALVQPNTLDKASNTLRNNLRAIAEVNDKDLYYTQSILVTTNWNKNDDIFSAAQVWAAKDTPSHKPTNLEHKESMIVGHITANWPITLDGILIDKNTPIENLPEKFHILTASVIYNGFTDPELRERTSKLIAEIENGTKYVSMECFFNDFDYGLQNRVTGEFTVVARDEETAFLTKHLRAYGGAGEHEDYKIGRVLKNITFSGKGFVDRPANPESIIFSTDEFLFENQKEKKQSFSNQGVFSNQAQEIKEAIVMSSETTKEEKVEAMNDCSEVVKEAYASLSEFKTKASDLENTLQTKEEALAESLASIEALKAENLEMTEAMKKMAEDMCEKEDEAKKMKAELDSAAEVLAAYKSKEEEMMKKEKDMKRKAALVEAGLDEESAVSSVEKFDALDDDAFDGMVALLAAMKPKEEEMKKEEPKKEEKPKAEDLSEALENAEPETEASLSVGSDNGAEEVETTRAALVDFVCNRLGKTL